MNPLRHARPAAAAALATLLALSPAAHAVIVFGDATMDTADFTMPAFSSDPSVVITASTLAAGGNPGSALQVHFRNDGSAPTLLSTQGFLRNGWSWDPAVQGALASLDFAHDRYTAFGDPLDTLLTTFSRALLVQGGVSYLAVAADPQVRGAWVGTGASGLTAADFSAFDFGTGATDALSHPDFSAAGAPIALGFASRLTLVLGAPFALDGEYRFDNLSFTLHEAQAVPEPAPLALAALGLGLVLRRRRPGA